MVVLYDVYVSDSCKKVAVNGSEASNVEGFNNRQFTPALAAKHVPKLLEVLPFALREAVHETPGQERLLPAQRELHCLGHVVQRAIMFFDILLVGRPASKYSAYVFTTLLEMDPQRNGALKAAQSCVRRVTQLAPPLLAVD